MSKIDEFFHGEIPALDADREGKLKGGFSTVGGGGIQFFTDTKCVNIEYCGNTGECAKVNKSCINSCGTGTGKTNNICTNTCHPTDNIDINDPCTNDCEIINKGCHNEAKNCAPEQPVEGNKSLFSLGLSCSALF